MPEKTEIIQGLFLSFRILNTVLNQLCMLFPAHVEKTLRCCTVDVGRVESLKKHEVINLFTLQSSANSELSRLLNQNCAQ